MNADYEQGYRDGESSGYADWILAVTEEFDIPDDVSLEGPQSFLAWLRQHKCITDHLWQEGTRGGSMGKEMICEKCNKHKYVPW